MNNYTTNPISTVAPVQLQPEYMRLPKPGTRDPVFGLPRTVLNELILPCSANKGCPPVRSVVLRKRGARTGIRLIDLDSLRAYLDKHVEGTYSIKSSCEEPAC
jgi:hypothetical protein